MVNQRLSNPEDLAYDTRHFYHDVLESLSKASVPFLVGGGYALLTFTGIVRNTKDIDLFVLPADAGHALDVIRRAGYRTELKFPHWLGKAFLKDNVVDVIFSSGNGLCEVDSEWFEHAIDATVLGVPVKLAPIEEMIWQKAFIMERHRYDGADVIHLIQSGGEQLNWSRLLRRFGDHWPVLLAHLVLAAYAYPTDQTDTLRETLRSLIARIEQQLATLPREDAGPEPICRGTFLSLLEYLPAVEQWGYRDARLPPTGSLTPREIAHWTTTFER